jgi:hypothetical protein
MEPMLFVCDGSGWLWCIVVHRGDTLLMAERREYTLHMRSHSLHMNSRAPWFDELDLRYWLNGGSIPYTCDLKSYT